jgi:hypothetical protein
VQVTGLAGDFCSPDCTTAACPTDVPTGVTATGQCLLKAPTGTSKKCCLVCSPTAIIKDQKAADAQCGTATCKAIQTTGICTYDDGTPTPAPVPPTPKPVSPTPSPSPPGPGGQSHYGDPAKGCLSDEEKVQITGLAGDFCAPDCTDSACPTDVPAGVTAVAQCLLKAPTGTAKKCCLVCAPTAIIKDQKAADAQCGTNASCKSIQATGICTYDDVRDPPALFYGV